MDKIDQSIFKAYDIRGIYPTQIDADLVYRIAQGYVKLLITRKDAESNAEGRGKLSIAVGHDMRLSGEEFSEAAIRGLTDAGVNVIDIGLVSTDQLYFAAATLPVDGGIQITASHNPKEFGGLKLVRAKGAPISGDSGIYQIRDLVGSGQWAVKSEKKGAVEKQSIYDDYYSHVLKTFDVAKFKPFKVVAHANFGMANPAIEKLKTILPIEFIKIVDAGLDGNFPKGASDPLLPTNRREMIAAVKELKPDLGVAWDGDGDRCFFYDECGEFVTPAYINALLSKYYLKKFPGAKILHDTRVVRVIDYVVEQNGGQTIMTKAGHSFIKERMIKEQAIFGSETSGHYYFKDNFYLDNGLIPFLAMLDILSSAVLPLPLGEGRAASTRVGRGGGEGLPVTFSELLRPLREKSYISEEINFEFQNPDVLNQVKIKYSDAQIDNVDGFDFNYPDWRFNLRSSNTQNLLRVNVEAKSAELLKQKTDEVCGFINQIKG
jgi:phosphomannomutase